MVTMSPRTKVARPLSQRQRVYGSYPLEARLRILTHAGLGDTVVADVALQLFDRGRVPRAASDADRAA